MATFTKFQQFVGDIGKKVHDLDADVLKLYFTNTAPSASADAVKADLPTEVSNGNGYTTGGLTVANNAYSQTSGTGKLTGDDTVLTATGAVGPFRYVVLYNDTPTSPADPLIGYWDYGSSVTLANGETFTVDFDGTNGIAQLA